MELISANTDDVFLGNYPYVLPLSATTGHQCQVHLHCNPNPLHKHGYVLPQMGVTVTTHSYRWRLWVRSYPGYHLQSQPPEIPGY